MKKLRVTIYVLLIFFGIVFAGLHTFVSIKGRELLTSKLHSVFQSEVFAGRVTTSFPLNLIVKDLEVKNWFKVKKVFAGTGIIDVLGGNFILSDLRLDGIEFELEKKKHGDQTQKPVDIETLTKSMKEAYHRAQEKKAK